MPSLATFAAFFVLGAALIAVPGPSIMFIVGRALQHGRREALLSVVGNALGVFMHVLLVAIGVGALIAASQIAFTVLKIGGGLYLIFLGVQQWRERKHGLEIPEDDQPVNVRVSTRRLLGESYVVGLTNPKTLVFFVAVLPQFADPSRGSVALQMVILGLMFMVMALIGDGTAALIASTARVWLVKRPKRIAAVRGVGGGLIAALGVLLLFYRKA